jgi:hypothetical protein
LAMWAFWRRRDLVAGLQSLRMKIYEDIWRWLCG